MNEKMISILLIEDDDVDAEAIERAFKKQKIANPIIRVSDGIEALACLRGSDDNKKINPPYIILLDINMPRMNGHEFLKEIRSDKTLHGCVVFVLTTSEADRDIDQAYAQNVAGYIVKSRAGSDFADLVGLVDHYWRYVELPRV
ncbi:response regulator [bacterium]|nr:response regulator [bacterium]